MKVQAAWIKLLLLFLLLLLLLLLLFIIIIIIIMIIIITPYQRNTIQTLLFKLCVNLIR